MPGRRCVDQTSDVGVVNVNEMSERAIDLFRANKKQWDVPTDLNCAKIYL